MDFLEDLEWPKEAFGKFVAWLSMEGFLAERLQFLSLAETPSNRFESLYLYTWHQFGFHAQLSFSEVFFQKLEYGGFVSEECINCIH